MSKILIVEDDTDILSIIEEKLEMLGFEITACNSHKDLNATIADSRPDIILLDIMLPEKDGLEIAG